MMEEKERERENFHCQQSTDGIKNSKSATSNDSVPCIHPFLMDFDEIKYIDVFYDLELRDLPF